MARARRTEQAADDLTQIWFYISGDSPAAADKLIREFDVLFQRLADAPRLGRQRPELGSEVRSFPHANYVVFYLPSEEGVLILRVLSGYRDIEGSFANRT